MKHSQLANLQSFMFQEAAKRRLANKPRKSLSLFYSVFDGLQQWKIQGGKLVLIICDVHAKLYGPMHIC